MPDKGFGPERSVAQYPGGTGWCHSCGFDVHPIRHNSKSCKSQKEGHDTNATVINQMGGSQQNKRLYGGSN